MEELKKTVSEHDVMLRLLTETLAEVKDTMKDVAKGVRSTELIIAKLAEAEVSFKESITRVHNRISVTEEVTKELSKLTTSLSTKVTILEQDKIQQDMKISRLESIWSWIFRITATTLIGALLSVIIVQN